VLSYSATRHEKEISFLISGVIPTYSDAKSDQKRDFYSNGTFLQVIFFGLAQLVVLSTPPNTAP
jgi:hypothetical protein